MRLRERKIANGTSGLVLVTSGAVSAGVAALGLTARPTGIGLLQALATAGQSRLMEHYNRALDAHGLVAAQVLLVPNDFVDRRQYLHARGTLTRLLDLGCIPIVNENDAIASHEIRFGDNDRIAALVAHNVNAELLVLLTDTPGLYTADPRHDPSAALIDEVAAGDPLLAVSATTPGRPRQRGHGVEAVGGADGVVVRRARRDRRGRRARTCWSTRSPARRVGTTFQPSSGGCRRASCGSPSPATSRAPCSSTRGRCARSSSAAARCCPPGSPA